MKPDLKAYLIAFVLGILFPYCTYSAINTDSLVDVINKQSDTIRINSMIKLASNLLSNSEDVIQISNEIIELSEAYDYDYGKASANSILGVYYNYKDEHQKALKYYFRTDSILKTMKSNTGQGNLYKNIGKSYFALGIYPKALKYFLQSLKAYESLKDTFQMGNCYSYLGSVYDYLKNYDKALYYLNLSYKISTKYNNPTAVAAVLNNMGSIYSSQKNYDKAIKLFEESLELDKQYGSKKNIAGSYNNIGTIYQLKKDIPNAFKYFNLFLKLSEEINDKENIAVALHNVGGIYLEKKEYDKAIDYFNRSLDIAETIGDIYLLKEIYTGLSEAFSAKGNFKKAFFYSKEYDDLKDSIYNTESLQQIVEMQTKYETEKQEQEITILLKDKENSELKLKKNRLLLIAFISGFVLFTLFSIFMLLAYRQKKKANKQLAEQKSEILEKNEELQQQKEEIEAQRDEINLQKKEIEKQRDIATRQRDELSVRKKEITDSITYAKNIQKAILQNEIILSKKQEIESFILLKPRDIVSGDFYWIKEITWKNSNKLLFAAADCTGHGVPGAFMSMLGTAFLNEIFNKFLDPYTKETELSAAEILNQLRNQIIHSLHQSNDNSDNKYSSSVSIKDGMDIALCILDTETNELQFAGANNPLWIVRSPQFPVSLSPPEADSLQSSVLKITDSELPNGDSHTFDSGLLTDSASGGLPTSDSQTANSGLPPPKANFEFIEIKGDKQPIGIYETAKPFSNHNIKLFQGDSFYLFSDGYADQFGGPSVDGNGKKFLYKRFKNLLLSIQEKTLFEQKNILNQAFESWKGNNFQVDDVLVIGIKISK